MSTAARHTKPKSRPCSHRRYLLSCDQYEELRARANHQCEICGRPERDELHGVLSVDHRGSLADWAVRGLLCNRCNTGLYLPAIAGEARDRFYANAWYVGMLSRLGLTPEPEPEPPVGSTVTERGRSWVRTDDGWVCQSRNAPRGPRDWRFLFRSYGPHNLVIAEATVRATPPQPQSQEEGGTMTITEFLTARMDEEEQAAKAAINPDRPGTHWHWVTNTTDAPVAPGDLAEAQQHQNVSLRTVEEFPTSSVGPLPAFLMYGEEVHPGAGEHIARHDPARVLREVASKRAILREYVNAVDLWERESEAPDGVGALQVVIRHMAAVWSDHPDYEQEWAL